MENITHDSYVRDQNIYSAEDYLDVWDFVSMDVITEKFWNENIDFIKELTFALYRIESHSGEFNLNKCARILETTFSNLLKFKMLK